MESVILSVVNPDGRERVGAAEAVAAADKIRADYEAVGYLTEIMDRLGYWIISSNFLLFFTISVIHSLSMISLQPHVFLKLVRPRRLKVRPKQFFPLPQCARRINTLCAGRAWHTGDRA